MPETLPAIPDGHALNPLTGELIDLSQPGEAARFIDFAKDLERRLREARGEAERVLAGESARQGSKTLRVDGYKITVSGGPETSYDIEVLAELLEAGLPEERYNEAVKMTVEYKPVAGELKRLAAANPDYAAIIERARITVEKPHSARVTKET